MKMRNLLLISAACLLSIFSSSAQSIPSYIPTNGLVGWWPFNGNANDESGNGNNGTVNGATLTKDRFSKAGNAYDFYGSNFIKIENSPSLNLNGSVSFSVWGRLSQQAPANIIHLRNNSNNHESSIRSNAPLNYDANNGISGAFISIASQIASDTSWHHFIAVFNMGNGISSFYVDGTLQGTSSISITSLGNIHVGIGAAVYSNFSNQFFLGSIDDVAIWNRALSAQEVSNLYQSSSTGSGGTAGGSKAFPRGISYQAIARNAQAQPLLNTALQLRFTILSDSINGSSEYVETQALNSNAQGLINTSIGSGTAQSGSWAAINWSAGRKFLRAEIDAGSGFVNLGTQEMLSVPFSQRSKSADAIENSGLPVYGSNAEALAAGLRAGQMYRTATGVLMVVF